MFFDNNLSPYLARGLSEILTPEGVSVVHLRDMFDPSISDVQWIESLSEEGDWVVISGDMRITKNKLEKAAWKRAGLTGFFLAKAWMHQDPIEQAWRLLKHWPTIQKQVNLVQPGASFTLPLQGKLKQL